MLTEIIPKLPMRNRSITLNFYVRMLGFEYIGSDEFDFYLILQKDNIQIHFFLFENLNPLENYCQVYIRTDRINLLFQSFLENGSLIHPNGHLELKPWGQLEFSILDPDHNLLTFGQTA